MLRRLTLPWQILIALVLGLAVGVWTPAFAQRVAILGEIFLAALRMIIVPIILAAVVTGVARMAQMHDFRRIGLRTVSYYMATTATAVAIGLLVVNLIRPGVGVVLGTSGDLPQAITAAPARSLGGFFAELLKGLLQNPFKSLAEADILSVIVFSLLFGAVLASLGRQGEPLVRVLESFNAVMMRLTGWIMRFAPIGIFGLIAHTIAESGLSVLAGLGMYCLTVVLGLGAHALILLWFFLRGIGGMPIHLFHRGVREPLAIAFSTSSSAAALPVTIDACNNKLKVPKRVTGFVLPLGATLNMDGTALYEAVAAMFIAQAYGIHLGPAEQFVIFLTAVLASIGAAAIPSAGLVTMVIVLTSVGLPLDGIGMILAVDRFLDMLRTTVNVMGDCVGTVVVSKGLEGKE